MSSRSLETYFHRLQCSCGIEFPHHSEVVKNSIDSNGHSIDPELCPKFGPLRTVVEGNAVSTTLYKIYELYDWRKEDEPSKSTMQETRVPLAGRPRQDLRFRF